MINLNNTEKKMLLAAVKHSALIVNRKAFFANIEKWCNEVGLVIPDDEPEEEEDNTSK